MKIPKYVFNEEGVTLDWQQEGSLVGYIRIHKDKDVIPGPVSYSCAVEVYKDNTFQFKLLKKHTEDEVVHLRTILRPVIEYLYSLGYKGTWTRFNVEVLKSIAISDDYFIKTSNEDTEG